MDITPLVKFAKYALVGIIVCVAAVVVTNELPEEWFMAQPTPEGCMKANEDGKAAMKLYYDEAQDIVTSDILARAIAQLQLAEQHFKVAKLCPETDSLENWKEAKRELRRAELSKELWDLYHRPRR